MSMAWNGSAVSVVATGAAYLEVMHQIMAAAQSAAQLDVAELIRDRTADGSLPTPAHTNGSAEPSTAAASAAADAAASTAVPCLSKRKTMDSDQDRAGEAEGSQMHNAKRLRVEGGPREQAQEANTKVVVTAGVSDHMGSGSEAAHDQLGPNHSGNPEPAESQAAPVAIQPGVSEQPPELAPASARGVAAGSAGGPGQEEGTTASIHEGAIGQPEASVAIPDKGTSQRSQQGLNSSRAQPGPSNHTQEGLSSQTEPGPSMHTQAGPNTHTHAHAGPSEGVLDQETEEDEDAEAKEKREQARNRTRAWRKVLLDGLDLQAELTAAAATAGHPDSDLAAAEAEVDSYTVELFLAILHGV